jgi:hypothetical protein
MSGNGVGSLDVLDGMENDPEVERNGMKSAAEYNALHWQRILALSSAAAAAAAAAATSGASRPPQRLMQDVLMGDRLHKIYQMNFGGSFGFDLRNTTWDSMMGSESLMAKWRSVMAPFEGVMLDGEASNLLTLLRVNPLDDCSNDTTVLVVPRLQFMLIEVARTRAGIYGSDFATQRCALLMQRVLDELAACLPEALAVAEPGAAADARGAELVAQLDRLTQLTAESEHYAIPQEVLRQTGAVKIVTALARPTAHPGLAPAQASAAALLGLWRAGVQLLKLPREHRAAGAELARAAVTLAMAITRAPVAAASSGPPLACLIDVVRDEDDQLRGRYVVAKQAVAPGEILLEESPASRAPFEPEPPLGVTGWKRACCFHCCRAAEDCDPSWAVPCNGCGIKAFEFCSPECCDAHGVAHAVECPLLSAVIPPRHHADALPIVPHFKSLLVLRLALRALLEPQPVRQALLLEHHRAITAKERPEYVAATLEAAERIAAAMPAAHLAAFAALAAAQEEGQGGSDSVTLTAVEGLQQIFFAIEVNAFGIGPSACSIMTGPAPMFNHSCLDNAHHSFAGFGGVGGSGADAGGLMQVRATRALAAGEEVLISYVPDLHEPTAVRRARTRKHKFFECTCARCADPTEQGRLALPLGAEWEALLATAHAARSTALTDHTAASLAKELAIRRVIAEHSEILYPASTHHTAKGVAQEALGKVAAELYMQEPQRLELAVEAEVALSVAQKNFTVCNGAHSAPVARVVGVLARLADATAARNE